MNNSNRVELVELPSTDGLSVENLTARLGVHAGRAAIIAVTGEILVVSPTWAAGVEGVDRTLGLCRFGPAGNFLASIEQSAVRSIDAWVLLKGVKDVLGGRFRAFSCECRGCLSPDPAGSPAELHVRIESFEACGSTHARVVLREVALPGQTRDATRARAATRVQA